MHKDVLLLRAEEVYAYLSGRERVPSKWYLSKRGWGRWLERLVFFGLHALLQLVSCIILNFWLQLCLLSAHTYLSPRDENERKYQV